MTDPHNIYDFKTEDPCFDISNPDHLSFIQPISQVTSVYYDTSPPQSPLDPCPSIPSLFFTHHHSEEIGGIKVTFATIPEQTYHLCAAGQLLKGDSVQLTIENTCLSNFRLYQPTFFTSETSLKPRPIQLCFKALDDTTTIYFQTDPQADCCNKFYEFRLTSLQLATDSIILPGIPLISGFIGAQGAQGPQGATGPLEFPNAPEGPQGPVSTSGPEPQGPEGPQGPPPADPLLLLPGPTGPEGPLGPDNPNNPQGPQGPSNANPISIGPQGPQGPQGDQGPQGVTGITGVSLITSVLPVSIDFTWSTDFSILLNTTPNPTPTTYEIHGNEVLLYLPEFTFNQNLNPNPASYILTTFIPPEIRPSQTIHEPILLSDGTICLMRFGPTQIRIYNGPDPSFSFFPVNQNFTLAPNQPFRYLL